MPCSPYLPLGTTALVVEEKLDEAAVVVGKAGWCGRDTRRRNEDTQHYSKSLMPDTEWGGINNVFLY